MLRLTLSAVLVLLCIRAHGECPTCFRMQFVNVATKGGDTLAGCIRWNPTSLAKNTRREFSAHIDSALARKDTVQLYTRILQLHYLDKERIVSVNPPLRIPSNTIRSVQMIGGETNDREHTGRIPVVDEWTASLLSQDPKYTCTTRGETTEAYWLSYDKYPNEAVDCLCYWGRYVYDSETMRSNGLVRLDF